MDSTWIPARYRFRQSLEILPKIFDPSFITKPDGTGLGLSISHGIVHDHRETVDVRSEVGKGTIFTVTFPLDVNGGV